MGAIMNAGSIVHNVQTALTLSETKFNQYDQASGIRGRLLQPTDDDLLPPGWLPSPKSLPLELVLFSTGEVETCDQQSIAKINLELPWVNEEGFLALAIAVRWYYSSPLKMLWQGQVCLPTAPSSGALQTFSILPTWQAGRNIIDVSYIGDGGFVWLDHVDVGHSPLTQPIKGEQLCDYAVSQ